MRSTGFVVRCACAVLCCVSALVWGDRLTVRVVDPQNNGFAGAVVEIRGTALAAPGAAAPAGIMDQIDKQFAPYILVVRQGALVDFPNSDSIQHHVYSFSEAKRFQLKLYKDQQPEPLLFDQTGVVALGCNIHDWMEGYIYVAQSDVYGRTDEGGSSEFELPPGDYQVSVWHPQFRDSDLGKSIDVSLQGPASVEYTLQEQPYSRAPEQVDEFDDY